MTVAGVVKNVCEPFHSTTSDLPMIRSSMTDCSNHSYPAVIRIVLILVFTGRSAEDIWILPSLLIVISAAVTPVLSQIGI